MARISKYQFDQDVTKEDFVIGSDGQTKKTRNYKLDDLTNFFAKQQAILGDKFAYTYIQTGTLSVLDNGKLSFNNYTESPTTFENITTVYLNRYNADGDDVYDYLVELKEESGVLTIHNAIRTTSFGAFRIQSINVDQNNVIQLGVYVLASNGDIAGSKTAIISAVFSNPDKTYVHSQLSSQTEWTVNHALNKFPSVSVVDDGNNIIVGDVKYIDKNQLTITFGVSISGKAYIN